MIIPQENSFDILKVILIEDKIKSERYLMKIKAITVASFMEDT